MNKQKEKEQDTKTSLVKKTANYGLNVINFFNH